MGRTAAVLSCLWLRQLGCWGAAAAEATVAGAAAAGAVVEAKAAAGAAAALPAGAAGAAVVGAAYGMRLCGRTARPSTRHQTWRHSSYHRCQLGLGEAQP